MELSLYSIWENAMRSSLKRTLLLPVLALALLAAACGGGAGTSAPADGAALTADNNSSAGGTTAGSTTGSATVDAANPFSGLPSIPYDDDVRAAADANTPQPPPNVVVLGKDFLQAQNDTVDGDAVVLTSGAAAPPGQGGGANLAYALYKVPGLSGGRPTALDIECLPGQFGQGYFVGVANYTQGKWAWFGPVTVPEFELDLSQNNHRFVTDLGNMYFILVCPPDTSVTHSQTTVLVGADGGQIPPGQAYGLTASDGQFDHKVAVDWHAGPGAQQYAVWRRPAFAGSQWQLLNTVRGTHYDDTPLPDFRLFYYRVQAINANGPADFSNPDSGYAGLQAPGDIAGTITGGDGTPLPGVPVMLAGYGDDLLRVTGPDGHFLFKDLPPSHYFVAPVGRDVDFDPPFAAGDLTSNQHVILNFTGTKSGDSKGLVWGFVMTPNTNPDGTGDDLLPLAGVTVTLSGGANAGGSSQTATTDEHGFYKFAGLDAGPYRVAPALDGYNFIPPQQGVLLGPGNTRERACFIGLVPPANSDPNNPGGDGNNPPPPPPPPPGGGDPNNPGGNQ
jgi:hypothetical protein